MQVAPLLPCQAQDSGGCSYAGPDSLDPDAYEVTAAGWQLTRELIEAERKFIHLLLRDGKITDEIRRRIERDLDLEEASLANREYRKEPP